MNRRGFLGMLLGAPVAAPLVAKEMARPWAIAPAVVPAAESVSATWPCAVPGGARYLRAYTTSSAGAITVSHQMSYDGQAWFTLSRAVTPKDGWYCAPLPCQVWFET